MTKVRLYNRALTAAEIQTDMNTAIGPDATPPALSTISASALTSSGATIGWTTNESSDSQVDYGPTTAYGSVSPLNGSLVTAHAVIVGALAGNTTYHFRVRSKDAAGNLALSGDFTFTTLAVDVTPPVISALTVSAITSGGATFSWTTNEASDSEVEYGPTTAYGGFSTLDVNRVPVKLSWDANTEPDVAGYKVYFGTASGSYSVNVDVGNVTDHIVTGLQTGTLYYFAVTAYNLSSIESGVRTRSARPDNRQG